jgi:hypothetical protein
MKPAEEFSPRQLVGKKVVFKQDEEHAGCWHARVGLKTGVVTKLGQSLAQKAELLGSEGVALPDALTDEAEVPRLWVHADPVPLFPQGCDAAVEQDCLLVPEP